MTSPTSLQAYSDCFEAMDAALEDPKGARLSMDDIDHATNFRMRIHTARRLDRERNAKVYPADHPLHGQSDYDRLVCRIKRENGQHFIYIEQIQSVTERIEPLSEVVPSPPDEPEKIVVQGFELKRRI